MTQPANDQSEPTEHNPPLLYQLEHDPSEQYDVAGQQPEVIEQIRKLVDDHRSKLRIADSRLEERIPRQ